MSKAVGMFRTDDANHSRERFPIQSFRFVDLPFSEELHPPTRIGSAAYADARVQWFATELLCFPVEFSASAWRPFIVEKARQVGHRAQCDGCLEPSTRCSVASESR